VNANVEQVRRDVLLAAFRMPLVQSMVSRKSSITNAFVNAVIPAIAPTIDEIEQALEVLGMDPAHVRCAYCGDAMTEWDHLRPLVVNRRPTGYISEIANLVPSCGKCNQSKGNKDWRKWIVSNAPRSPAGRGIAEIPLRISRLADYEKWRSPTRVDFESVIGKAAWEEYWSFWDSIITELRRHQQVADVIRSKIVDSLRHDVSSPNDTTP
jgi:hypothetical protein